MAGPVSSSGASPVNPNDPSHAQLTPEQMKDNIQMRSLDIQANLGLDAVHSTKHTNADITALNNLQDATGKIDFNKLSSTQYNEIIGKLDTLKSEGTHVQTHQVDTVAAEINRIANS